MVLTSFDENSNLYFDLCLKLADKNYEVIIMDYYGHGFSSGPKSKLKLAYIFQDLTIML
jgi:hypothetical protein